jgi:hypothetical protein
VSNLPALTSLDLACCYELTDEALRAVRSLPALEYLNLSYCESLTDEALQALETAAGSDLEIEYASNRIDRIYRRDWETSSSDEWEY